MLVARPSPERKHRVVTATVIPFAPPAACPGHRGGRFTPAGIALIRRHHTRAIAAGRVSRIELARGEDGDAAHVVDAAGEVLASFYLHGGLVHAVGPLGGGAGGVAAARGRTVAAALVALAARGRS